MILYLPKPTHTALCQLADEDGRSTAQMARMLIIDSISEALDELTRCDHELV